MLGSMTWIGMHQMITASVETVLWNNSHSIFEEGQSSLEAFRNSVDHMKTQVIQNYTRLLNTDLGEF